MADLAPLSPVISNKDTRMIGHQERSKSVISSSYIHNENFEVVSYAKFLNDIDHEEKNKKHSSIRNSFQQTSMNNGYKSTLTHR
jgi:hypothetical protein